METTHTHIHTPPPNLIRLPQPLLSISFTLSIPFLWIDSKLPLVEDAFWNVQDFSGEQLSALYLS